MDLIYKISGAYLYDNQLNHDYLFFYNRKKSSFRNELNTDADYLMFGSSEFCANTEIYNMDKNDPLFLEKSIEIMTERAEKSGVLMIKSNDFITLEAIGEEKGRYIPYNILWNETKSGINPFEWEVAGVWNPGQSTYSKIRLWESKDERESTIRDNKLKEIGL